MIYKCFKGTKEEGFEAKIEKNALRVNDKHISYEELVEQPNIYNEQIIRSNKDNSQQDKLQEESTSEEEENENISVQKSSGVKRKQRSPVKEIVKRSLDYTIKNNSPFYLHLP